MILYTAHITPRVAYMAQWMGLYFFGKPLIINSNKESLNENEPILNYSAEQLSFNNFQIHPQPLLLEAGIQQQTICVKKDKILPYFFETPGDFYFDVLAASFYLMQRYEEYLPYQKDQYGRYAHQNSIAFKENFLHLPLVNLWMEEFKKVLLIKFPTLAFKEKKFHFIPTYDIDIAYSYKGKGVVRSLGRIIKSFLKGNSADVVDRVKVVTGKEKDPFDIYDELDELHQYYNLNPIYFFLLAAYQKGYDKNISVDSNKLKSLISSVSAKYITGIHPSWQSFLKDDILLQEINTYISLAQADKCTVNRQHYIRFVLPQTFQQLLDKTEIRSEYSMGYGSINGFRASVSTPYYWYNLEMEKATELEIHPFCYMEANSIYEQNDTTQQALVQLIDYANVIKAIGGTMITVFHNSNIGRSIDGRKWMEMYKQFLNHIKYY